MRYPLFLCMLVSILFVSSCGNDKPNPNEPENPDDPSGKIELWSRDKIVRYESKYENSSSSQVYTYDSQGRETSYKQYEGSNLRAEHKNYSYNDLICTYDAYSKGIYGYTTTIEFYDKSWNSKKIKSFIAESQDMLISRSEYQYDNQGREIGFKSYNGNMLILEYKNYQYKEDRWSYDRYDNSSSFVATTITEYTHNDIETVKREYTANAPNSYGEWRYDSEGREVGYKRYQHGILSVEYKNYVYEGKTCTYDNCLYNSVDMRCSIDLVEYY